MAHRAVRISMFSRLPGAPPMTAVTFEEHLNVSLDEFIADMRANPAMFVVADVFETAATDELSATMEAQERVHPQEPNMAVMYWWTIQQFERVNDTASVGMTGPNPLTEAQTIEVFEQVIGHPAYVGQRVMSPVREDERCVVIDQGAVRGEVL